MVALAEVLSAFNGATGLSALNLAGGLLITCAGLGGLLLLAWVFRVGQEAMRGTFYHAPRVLMLVIAAFLVLIVTLGVFYV